MRFDDPITDCEDLRLGVEISLDTSSGQIDLNLYKGNMTVDGVTAQALYSFLKHVWLHEPGMLMYIFPMAYQK